MPSARNRTFRSSCLPSNVSSHAEANSRLPILTAGEVFSDGAVIELIRDGETGDLSLLLFDGETCDVARRIETRGRVFEPSQVHPSIARALTLPTRCLPYGSTRELFEEVFRLISRVTRLSEDIVVPLAFSLFASWLPDCLPVAPFLWIIAPPTASSSALMQLLCLLCRRALFVAELTPADLRSLPMHLKPTIVSEVSTITRPLIKALRASNRQGTYAAARDKVLDLFCAKVVFANQPLRDPASAGFPLEIALGPTRDHVPLMDLEEAERVAAEFHAKFLMYRICNYHKVKKPPSFDLAEFTPPMQERAYSLAACIVGDNELQSRIVPLVRQRDREIRVDRTTLPESIVIEALLAACHDAQWGTVPMGDLTQSVNTILGGRGEARQQSPETVGWKLRGLGLRTDFMSGGRKGLALLDETRAKIHDLAAAYGVRTLRQGLDSHCPQCATSQFGTGFDAS